MQLLIVPDSFKESLSATDVADAISKGIESVDSNVVIKSIPFSDGGEGALTVLDNHAKGSRVSCDTVNPLGKKIVADYFLFDNKTTAWIELSQASGITILKKEELNPSLTSTFGTGLQINHAIKNGCTKIILGIGGSATNDGGAGIFQALGGKLIDSNGEELKKGGAALINLNNIVLPQGLDHIEWVVACDVQNTLLGPEGASSVYGPQKGASEEDVIILDESLTQFAKIIKKELGNSIDELSGGGAAGGTAAGMHGFFRAELSSGFDLLAKMINLEESIRKTDMIFTAEGKIDQQSLKGKVPIGVARLAKKYNKPCVGLAGIIEDPLEPLYKEGFSGLFNIQNSPMSYEQSKLETKSLLQKTASRVFTFYKNIH